MLDRIFDPEVRTSDFAMLAIDISGKITGTPSVGRDPGSAERISKGTFAALRSESPFPGTDRGAANVR